MLKRARGDPSESPGPLPRLSAGRHQRRRCVGAAAGGRGGRVNLPLGGPDGQRPPAPPAWFCVQTTTINRRFAIPRRFATLVAALLLLTGAVGCSRGSSPDRQTATAGTLQIMIGTTGDEQLSGALVEEQNELIRWIQWCFDQVYPGVQLVLNQYREADIPRELGERDRDGMAPDLLLVNASTARELWRRGLTRALPASSAMVQGLRERLRRRIAINSQSLIGLPVLITSQLSCFNRKRVPHGLGNLAALEASSEQGVNVGMSVEPLEVYWTAGALGANPAMQKASRGEALGPADRRALLTWLSWLHSVSLHERVSFYNNQEQLIQALTRGELDWITCPSTSLQRLRRSLGDQLGVAALPRGPGGEATPPFRFRLWVFGRNSSPLQQRTAEAFARFSLSAPMQRYLTLHTQMMLPARRVSIPTRGRPLLQAMVESDRQTQATEGLGSQLRSGDPRLDTISSLLLRLSYHEISPARALAELQTTLRRSP